MRRSLPFQASVALKAIPMLKLHFILTNSPWLFLRIVSLLQQISEDRTELENVNLRT